ncbi:MAG: hypothetical protein ILA22_01355, partial [Prevotella sp.]|nr:hypothetical protein [Prevotella sp.]
FPGVISFKTQMSRLGFHGACLLLSIFQERCRWFDTSFVVRESDLMSSIFRLSLCSFVRSFRDALGASPSLCFL